MLVCLNALERRYAQQLQLVFFYSNSKKPLPLSEKMTALLPKTKCTSCVRELAVQCNHWSVDLKRVPDCEHKLGS